MSLNSLKELRSSIASKDKNISTDNYKEKSFQHINRNDGFIFIDEKLRVNSSGTSH